MLPGAGRIPCFVLAGLGLVCITALPGRAGAQDANGASRCPPLPASFDIDSLNHSTLEHVNDACAWLKLGQARLALARQGAPVRFGPGQPIGTDNAHGAGRAFMRAIALNPTDYDAANGLLDALAAQDAWVQGDDALRSLRRATQAGSPPASILLGRARLERIRGERDSTAPLLRRYRDEGGDVAVADFELAREAFFHGDFKAGVEAYYGGTALPSPTARALYQHNLALIAEGDELAVLDSAGAAGLADAVRAFWIRREAHEGRAAGERLAEHFRRIERADRYFTRIGHASSYFPDGLTIPSVRTPFVAETMLTLEDTLLNKFEPLWNPILPRDRITNGGYTLPGNVFLRHGVPDDMAGEFWAYDRLGGRLVLRVGTDYPGLACDLAVRYCDGLELQGRPMMPRRARSWVSEWSEMMTYALTTDDYPLRFARELHPVVSAYALFDSAGADGQLLVSFAIRAQELEAVTGGVDSARVMFPLGFRIIAFDPSGSRRVDLDSTRLFTSADTLDGASWLIGALALPLPAGTWNMRTMIQELGSLGERPADSLAPTRPGVVVGRQGIHVGRESDALALSDLVPGMVGSGLAWRNGAAQIALNPLGVWPRGRPIRLYYEASGLRTGAPLRTTIRILRGSDERSLVQLSFSDPVASTRQAFMREIATHKLPPGQYIIEVELRDSRNVQVRRRNEVRIEEGKPGRRDVNGAPLRGGAPGAVKQ
jgi:hypothetical protein